MSTPQHSPIKAKLRGRKGRELERRWTIGVEKGQLNLAMKMADEDTTNTTSPEMSSLNCPSNFSLASWSSTASDLDSNDTPIVPAHLMNTLRTPTPTNGSFSQPDVPQEINKHYYNIKGNNHQYQLSYEMAVDSSPLSPSNYVPSSQEIAYRAHVVDEIISTERQYVKDLNDIIKGYYDPLHAMVVTHGKAESAVITAQDIADLFGNILEILSIHRSLLEDLEQNQGDLVKMGNCFISRAEDFKSYTEYCNNYPKSIKTFSKFVSDQGIPKFMKTCQQKLNHLLPLGAYLLKPVQRILKYFLLLEDLHRHMKHSTVGYSDIMNAKFVMSEVADHINEMKRKYDRTVRVQELQNLLHGWEGKDLIKYGEIVLENNLKVAYSKSGHSKLPSSALKSTKETHVILFRKMLLITKKKDEDYQYKHHVEMKDMQLSENLKENNLLFQIRQISTKATLTFQARTPEIKTEWADQIKELLLESIPDLPDKAKLLILQGFPTDIHKGSQPKTSIESCRTMPRDLHLPNSGRNAMSHSKLGGSSPKQPRTWLKKEPANQKSQSKSFVEAGLFLSGYGVANSTQNHKKPVQQGKSLDQASNTVTDELKKSRRLRFGSLPNAVIPPKLRKSDSDPNLPEEDLSRPSSRGSSVSGKVSPYGVNSIAEGDNSRSSSGSPSMNHLAVISGVRNSMSSPDLKKVSEMGGEEQEEDEEEKQPEEQDDDVKKSNSMSSKFEPPIELDISPDHHRHRQEQSDNSPTSDINRPLTPLSPANDSEVSFNIGDDSDPFTTPMHMRSKSAPVHVHEPSLETIPSTDNTPRGSLAKDDVTAPPYIIHMEADDDEDVNSSSPLIVLQSPEEATEKNLSISIKPSLEYSNSGGMHNGFTEAFAPPNVGKDTITKSPSLQLETNDSPNRRKMELMFAELMSSSNSQSVSPHSQEAVLFTGPPHDDGGREDLSQPTDMLSSPISPISIPEIKVDLAGDHKKLVSNDSMGSIGENTGSSMRYSKQTTPYTSIEDLPSEAEKWEDDDTNSESNSKSLWRTKEGHLSPTNDATVKRWHSLHSHRTHDTSLKSFSSVRQHSQPTTTSTSTVTNTKSSEKAEWSSFLRRNHSFKDTRPNNVRPISLVALVHSTRDTSDLVDLKDMMKQQRRNSDPDETEVIVKELPSKVKESFSSNAQDSDDVNDHHHSRITSEPAMSYESSDHKPPIKRDSVVSNESERSFAKRRNRWSLKRSFQRSKRKISVPQQDSTSDDEESKCSSSVSEVSISDVPLTPTGNDNAFLPSFSGSPDDEIQIEGTNFGDNLEATNARRFSKVHAMARDYSMRIKEKHSASCSPVQEEQGSQASLVDDSNNSTSPTPVWVKHLKDKRRSRTNTVTEGTFNRTQSYSISMSQPTSPEPRSPNSLRSASLTPTTGIHTPSSTDTTTGTFNFDRNPSSPTAMSCNILDRSNMSETATNTTVTSPGMKSYSSETALTKSIDSVLDMNVAPTTTHKTRKKPGWVRYLVKKFNTHK